MTQKMTRKNFQEGLVLQLIWSFRCIFLHFHLRLIVMKKTVFSFLHTILNLHLDNIFFACFFLFFLMEIHASVAWKNLAVL